MWRNLNCASCLAEEQCNSLHEVALVLNWWSAGMSSALGNHCKRPATILLTAFGLIKNNPIHNQSVSNCHLNFQNICVNLLQFNGYQQSSRMMKCSAITEEAMCSRYQPLLPYNERV